MDAGENCMLNTVFIAVVFREIRTDEYASNCTCQLWSQRTSLSLGQGTHLI